jgi:XTP/dITP diphosphohydrolase
MELFIATTNPGKVAEFKAALAGVATIKTPADFPELDGFEVEEIGKTFAEIAELKARTFGDKVGLLTVADDSGLEVEALDGQPGVYSHRFAPGTDEDRYKKLLSFMSKETNRAARFVTVLCLYDPATQKVEFFPGEVQGQIAPEPTGTQGFGYDPVFKPEGYDQTFAELGIEVKNTMSHRGRAVAALQTYLASHLSPSQNAAQKA